MARVDCARWGGTAEHLRHIPAAWQRGLALHYDFPFPDSATVQGVASFYQDAGGAYRRFTVVDHRTGSAYLARFASDLTHTRGPAMIRQLVPRMSS